MESPFVVESPFIMLWLTSRAELKQRTLAMQLLSKWVELWPGRGFGKLMRAVHLHSPCDRNPVAADRALL